MGQRKTYFSGEKELEPDYPITSGFWYLLNGEPWQSDVTCHAGDLLGAEVQSDGESAIVINSVHTCNYAKRSLGRSNSFPGGEQGMESLFGMPCPRGINEDDIKGLFRQILEGGKPGASGSNVDPLMEMLMSAAGEDLFNETSEPDPQSDLGDEMKAQRYLAQAPVIIEGNTLRFDMEQAQALVANAPEALKMRPSPDLRKMQEDFMERYKRAVIHLKDPDVEVASVPEDVAKHFMMVSPHQMPFFYWPEEQLEKWSRWEALRRAIELSGAKVTVPDPRDENNPKYFVCRDSYALVNNVAYVSDYKGSFGNMMMSAFTDIIGIEDKASDGPRLNNFFNRRGQICAMLEEDGNFDGGNIIVHPQSKTVFMGGEGRGSGMMGMGIGSDMNAVAARSFQEALDRTQDDKWEVVPVVLREVNHNPITNIQAVKDGNSTPFYHLDTGMSEPLANGEVLLHAGMCDYHSFEAIIARVGAENIVSVTRDEGVRRSLNLISNGPNVIVSDPSKRLRGIFKERGYPVITAEDFGVKRLGMSDGDPHCMTNVIEQPDVA